MFTQRVLKRMETLGIKEIPISTDEILGRPFARTIVDPKTREVIVRANDVVSDEVLSRLKDAGIQEFELLVDVEHQAIHHMDISRFHL